MISPWKNRIVVCAFWGGTVYLWIYTLAIRASILSLALFILPLGHKSWIWLAVRFLLSLAICLLLWNFDSAFANIGQNIVDPIYDDLRNVRIFWVLASAILIGTFVAEVVAGVLTRPAKQNVGLLSLTRRIYFAFDDRGVLRHKTASAKAVTHGCDQISLRDKLIKPTSTSTPSLPGHDRRCCIMKNGMQPRGAIKNRNNRRRDPGF